MIDKASARTRITASRRFESGGDGGDPGEIPRGAHAVGDPAFPCGVTETEPDGSRDSDKSESDESVAGNTQVHCLQTRPGACSSRLTFRARQFIRARDVVGRTALARAVLEGDGARLGWSSRNQLLHVCLQYQLRAARGQSRNLLPAMPERELIRARNRRDSGQIHCKVIAGSRRDGRLVGACGDRSCTDHEGHETSAIAAHHYETSRSKELSSAPSQPGSRSSCVIERGAGRQKRTFWSCPGSGVHDAYNQRADFAWLLWRNSICRICGL